MGQLDNVALQRAQIVVRHELGSSGPCQISQEHCIGPVQGNQICHAAVIYKITGCLICLVQHLDLGRTCVNDLA